MLVILVPWVITFPKHTGGAPFVLLALLLGAGDCGGVPLGLEASEVSRDLGICWLVCGSVAEVSKNTLMDV